MMVTKKIALIITMVALSFVTIGCVGKKSARTVSPPPESTFSLEIRSTEEIKRATESFMRREAPPEEETYNIVIIEQQKVDSNK